MSEISINQRGATRNQSTADFQVSRPFIWRNKFQYGVFKNNTAAAFNLTPGQFVARNPAVAGGLIPLTYVVNEDLSITTNAADVIGITAQEGSTPALAINATQNISYCYSGGIDVTQLVLPGVLTLDTMIGNKAFRDILAIAGFELDNTTIENTQFDN